MSNDDEQLIPVFIPALGPLLINAEDRKGTPLSYDEVIRLRDGAACIMMSSEHALAMEKTRGYRDIDPENCWFDWQHLRRELGRKPDLDPGPQFNLIPGSSPEYRQTIHDARATLDEFRRMLPADGSPRHYAMIKTEIRQGDEKAFMWLNNVSSVGKHFVAEFFELGAAFTNYRVGDRFEIPEHEILDWMVNDNGVAHGGFSIRQYRSTLPEPERDAYDQYIGVTRFA
jgi:uncharacterized protein YegJ (DUF2314 family)